MRSRIALAILFLLSYHPAQSQILRVDKNHLESDSAGYFALYAEANFSLDNRSVSPDEKLVYTRLSSKADVLYVSKRHAYILINSIEYQSSTNATPFSTGYTHFRINFRRQHKISYETYAQIQYDEVRRMELRMLAGGGIRFTAIDQEGVDIHLGSGAMYEVERWREIENDPSSDFYKEMPKLSNYLGVEFTLSKHVNLNLWGLYQVGYDSQDDITRNRYAIEASLNFKLSKRLIWINRFTYFYDAQPVIPINPAFYQIINGLRITF
jgi:Protein of unknown function, DUF481